MARRLSAIASLSTFSVLAGCGDIYPWTAFVNSPWKDPPEAQQVLGPFWSLENCRAAANAKLEALGWTRGGAYSCGFRCEKRGDSYICKGMQR